ncbi:MAG: acyl-ACP--UDP-N-acetylglucosamine O-acyltransferase [Candidatus Eremiobacteraeota bacterium]|nr:acyl-ACP--UDP-N-acetylglucosamine O-acyltransferase [Candidatus Eremiobacteraeota bacterium]
MRFGRFSRLIHPTAIVHPKANIERGVEIGPYCLVGANVAIGRGTILQAHVVVNGWTTIGEDCRIYPFATIGSASQDRKYEGERAFTTIGNRTTIREYVSIQRATGEGETTAIGDDCLLLAYVHIAHNCRLGNGITMSNLAQLAGHVTIGDNAGFGGIVGVHQFVRIGKYAFIGGYTRLTRDVPPFFLCEGNPARAYGLNSPGLKRAGFSNDEITEIKRFYKLLYGSKLKFAEALAEMQNTVQTQAGRELIAFLEADSDRGILK